MSKVTGHETVSARRDRASQPDGTLTDLMKAHLDDVTGGLAAGHNSWRQRV
ncbi:MAG: hypothetical protein HC774_06725 [Sphingomonadales bacterium]|jgi:hypothetical protein|nr:hypothetical protein [Sphingomonadales bacterium]